MAGEDAGAVKPSVAGDDLRDDGSHRAERCCSAWCRDTGFGQLLKDQAVDVWAFRFVRQMDGWKCVLTHLSQLVEDKEAEAPA